MIDYTQWCPDPFLLADAEIVADYAEYSGEDPFEVAAKITSFKELTTPEYHKLGSEFYTKSENYIYDILGGNPIAGVRANLLNKFIPNCVQTIKDHPGTTFADFGAGVGACCEIVHTFCNKRVTHIDLFGPLVNFAEWRYQKYEWDIDVHRIHDTEFPWLYPVDIMLTDAVWEHLDPQMQIDYARQLPTAINPNGLLFFLVDLSGPTPDMPMHYDVDIVAVHDAIESAGMTCEYGRNTFASQWTKK